MNIPAKLRDELVASDDALGFLKALVTIQAYDAENVLDMLDKPWKWQIEWELWLKHGKPRSTDDDGFEAWSTDVDEAA